MISELYDALLDGGTSDAKARSAAAAVAEFETRFAAVERDLAVIKWSQAIVVGGIVALLLRAFVTN